MNLSRLLHVEEYMETTIKASSIMKSIKIHGKLFGTIKCFSKIKNLIWRADGYPNIGTKKIKNPDNFKQLTTTTYLTGRQLC